MKKILLAVVLVAITATLALAVDISGEARGVFSLDDSGLIIKSDRLRLNFSSKNDDGTLSAYGRLEGGFNKEPVVKYAYGTATLFDGMVALTAGRFQNYDYTTQIGANLYWYSFSDSNDGYSLAAYEGALIQVLAVDGLSVGVGVGSARQAAPDEEWLDKAFVATTDISILDLFVKYTIADMGAVVLEYSPAAGFDMDGSFLSATVDYSGLEGIDVVVGGAKAAGGADWNAFVQGDYSADAIRVGAGFGATFAATLDWAAELIASYDVSDALYAGVYASYDAAGSYTAAAEIGWKPVSKLLITVDPAITDGAMKLPIMFKANF